MDTKETLPEMMGRQLTEELQKQTRWMTTGEFRHRLGFTRRDCKAARDAAGPFEVISTGKGYRATEFVTDAELTEAQAMFEAQAEAARLNAEGVLAVRLSRMEGKVSAAEKQAAVINALVADLKARRPVDVRAVLKGIGAA